MSVCARTEFSSSRRTCQDCAGLARSACCTAVACDVHQPLLSPLTHSTCVHCAFVCMLLLCCCMQIDDIKKHRYDVADVLNDCCEVLGAVYCLSRVLAQLEAELA